MTSLVEFIEARMAEDEQIARAASVRPSSPRCEGDAGEWRVEDRHGDAEIITGGMERDNSYGGRGIFGSWNVVRYDGGASLDEGEHIARHDPARVLREVKAKRSLLLDLRNAGCSWCADVPPGPDPGITGYGYDLAKHLAAVYSDHPDYQEKWTL